MGIEDIPEIEIGYELDQNYPNPFSIGGGSKDGSTVIDFKLRQAGYVIGVVYDLLGSEVATLIDGEMSKGTHSVKFDGYGLSPGVYIFRITSMGQTKAIKMVLGK
ncbi:MAG: T9SS type A sorting domain-containing protein [Ignavibacteriales bacterium]|nr:T9SS type A sorting domain-containing protein [Ignavibacteriales bacterium]